MLNLQREHSKSEPSQEEAQKQLGWQKFYSHDPLFSIEDLQSEAEKQGWREARQAHEYQLMWEQDERYDADTAWMM